MNYMSFKLITTISRFILSYTLFYSFFFDTPLNQQICGPFTIPIQKSQFQILIILEFFRLFYPITSKLMPKSIFFSYYCPKYILLLLFKLFLLDYDQSKGYYIAIFIMQFLILLFSIIFDITNNRNMAEVWEIVGTDTIHRTALIYEMTRTFCPNFAFYWFILNFITLGMSQIEAHNINPNKIKKNQAYYKSCLYVKQDVYRILILGFVYFAVFSYMQSNIYGWGMMVTFGILALPFWLGTSDFQEGKNLKSLFWLTVTCFIISGYLQLRVYRPQLFKELGTAELPNTEL